MRPNELRSRLNTGQFTVNAWVSLNSPYAAEVLSHAGFDAVTVDLQHGMFGIDGAIPLLQAISAGPATPLARCTGIDAEEIGKLLDAGAYGIICPSVDTAEDCESFVAACRYPPTGRRSFGPSRGLLYGGADYALRADGEILAWAMIESVDAVRNLDAILAVPGLDAVYIGPNDLALSMGMPPGSAAALPPQLEKEIAGIVHKARDAGLFTGIFASDGVQGRHFAELGCGLVTPGNDVSLLRTEAAHRIAQLTACGGERG